MCVFYSPPKSQFKIFKSKNKATDARQRGLEPSFLFFLPKVVFYSVLFEETNAIRKLVQWKLSCFLDRMRAGMRYFTVNCTQTCFV